MIMRELVSTLQSLLGKIEEGTITQAEMEQMVADARELNERLIVLRYKIYEQGIFEIPTAPQQELEVELPEIELNLEINEEPQNAEISEGLLNIATEEFDEDHAFSEALNEAIKDFTPEELNFEPTQNEVPSSPEVEVNNPLNSELFSSELNDDEPTVGLNFENQEEEQIIHESTVISTSFDEETNSEVQEITHQQTSVIESKETTTFIETEETTKITVIENQEENVHVTTNEPITNESNPIAQSQVSTSDSGTENKLKSIEQSIRINYSIVPLETLIGSFTLNERLQFINELFEGSSDSFSSAVKKLDMLDGLDSARTAVGEFASTNNWDLESEIVEDFLVKICRRYA
jgi:hypothetical protein